MSSTPWVDDPLVYVDSLYQNYRHDNSKNLLSVFRDSFKHRLTSTNSELTLYFETELPRAEIEKNLNKICVIRGMVQDFGESELFALKYFWSTDENSDVKESTAFLRDNAPIPDNVHIKQDGMSYADRISLKIVPVPNENSWVKEFQSGNFRVFDAESFSGDETCGEYDKNSKMGKFDNVLVNDLEFKFYGNESEVSINSVYEFYGTFEQIETSSSEMSNNNDQCIDQDAVMDDQSCKRAPFVFHAIFAKPVSSAVFPDVNSIITDENLNQACGEVTKTKGELMNVLNEIFMGDSDTAHWLLLHLISSVYKRADVMPIGSLSLNITNCNGELVRKLTALIKSVVPSVLDFKMTVQSLNNTKLVPHKDVDTGILHTGLLQLAPGTSIVIDETCMEPGQLTETGIRNLSALTSLVQWQKVLYDFKYQHVEIMSNYNVVILSSTKSLIKSAQVVQKWTPNDSFLGKMSPGIGAEKLVSIRQYLTLSKFLPYVVPPPMSEVAQKFFVEVRQKRNTYTTDDFHHLLNVARLESLSNGCMELNCDTWNNVLTLLGGSFDEN